MGDDGSGGREKDDEVAEGGTSDCCSFMRMAWSQGPPSTTCIARDEDGSMFGDMELVRVEPGESTDDARLWVKMAL